MIIAVWGNNGAGKSTLAVKLASSFARQHKNVVLVDTNYSAPQSNVWYPNLPLKRSDSLSILLDNDIPNVEVVASKIQVVSDNIGVLGYAKDYSSNMVPSRSDTPTILFERLVTFSDVVIVDCQSAIVQDILSFTALDEAADVRIVTMTPDLRGLSWYDANVRMVEENWANNGKTVIKTFNKVRLDAPVADLEKIIGTAEYYLPFDVNIQRELFAGTLGGEGHRKNSRQYTRVVDSIANDITKRIEK
ncbi:MAG: hypothetical protein KBS44_04230 [Clostridiales bacterium]|nr:hypothetical protein [Candidatus Coliplasma equi]